MVGDSIAILDDIYDVSGMSAPIEISNDLKITGGRINVDGNTLPSYGAFSIYSGNFTLEADSLYFNNNNSGVYGGAVTAVSGGTTRLTAQNDIEFKNNSSGNQGGAVFDPAGQMYITSTDGGILFEGNHADSTGGAIAKYGPALTIEAARDIVFRNNWTENGGGGAINSGALIYLTSNNGSIIFDNNRSNAGGAIHYTGTHLDINAAAGDIIFKNNESDVNGGALFTINNVGITAQNGSILFKDNKAKGQDGYGGAIHTVGGSTNIIAKQDISFIHNIAGDEELDIWGTGGAIAWYSSGNLNIRSTDGNIFFGDNKAMNGGALYFVDGAGTSTISADNGSVIFHNNTAVTEGGAIRSGKNTTIDINAQNDIIFSDNTALVGGAIFAYGDLKLTSTDGSIVFDGNTATDAPGGAIFASDSNIDLTAKDNIVFTNNHVQSSSPGGAIQTDSSNLNITSTDGSIYFGHNGIDPESPVDHMMGGALMLRGTTILDAAKDIIFESNRATNHGGAVFLSNGSLDMTSGGSIIFLNNSNVGTVGFQYGGALGTYGNTTLNAAGDIAFVGNSAGTDGGGLYSYGEGTSLTSEQGNILFYGNTTGTNTANAEPSGGGAIFTTNGGVTLDAQKGVLFSNNNLDVTTSGSGAGGGAVFSAGNGLTINSSYVIFFNNSTTINNGDATDTNDTGGGALYVTNGGTRINSDGGSVIFDSNTLTGGFGGGAVYSGGNGLTINNTGGDVVFSNNSATLGGSFGGGGALYVTAGGARINTDGNIIFDGNTVTGGQGGGAILFDRSGMVSELTSTGGNIIFANNTSSTSGGALYFNNNTYGAAISAAAGSIIFDGNTADAEGGAIRLGSGTTLDINAQKDIIFSDNHSNIGGAVFTYDGLNLTSADGNIVFDGNSSKSGPGGAIFSGGGDIDLTAKNNIVFTNNHVLSSAPGGAMQVSGSTLNITSTDGSIYFGHNGTDPDSVGTSVLGGAIAVMGSPAIIKAAKDIVFESNHGTDQGGAIFSSGGPLSIETLAGDVIFANNQVLNATKGGGAIFAGGGDIDLTAKNNIIFTNNTAIVTDSALGTGGAGGGAINFADGSSGGIISAAAGSIIFNNNTTNGEGGGIRLSAGSTLDLNAQNDIVFSGNTGLVGGAIFTYDDLKLTSANGNIVFDGNSSTSAPGGAIYYGNPDVSVDLTAKNNIIFTNNHVNGSSPGGAIYASGDTLNIKSTDGSIYFGHNGVHPDSTASGLLGGALFLSGTTILEAAKDIIFESNHAANQGGAVFLSNGSLDITSSDGSIRFLNNTNGGDSNGFQGGALVTHAKTELSAHNDISFAGNKAGTDGGAIYNTRELSLTGDNILFYGNTTGLNAANPSFGGGAVFTVGDLSLTASNGDIIFANNTATVNGTEGGGGALFVGDGSAQLSAPNGSIIFVNNTLIGGAGGGAIYWHIASDLTFNSDPGDVIFDGNTFNGTPNDIHFGLAGANLVLSGDDNTIYLGGGITAVDNGVGNEIIKDGSNTLVLGPAAVNENFHGNYTQTAGTLTNYSSSFFGGTNTITDSDLNFFQTKDMTINDLYLDNVNVSSMNNAITTTTIDNFGLGDGGADFKIDISVGAGISDRFDFKGGSYGDTTNPVNISDINIMGGMPTAKEIAVQVFTYDGDAPELSESIDTITTPLFDYEFVQNQTYGNFSLLRGNMNLANTVYNRGQVSTVAAMQNQLLVTNTLFEHIYLDNNELVTRGGQNKYSGIVPQLSPYQFGKEDGSLWFKTYTAIERLGLTHGIDVNNTAYGTIVGADMPAVQLKDGWKFIPTAFIAYNGGRQSYGPVTTYQNGGQGGFMGTFSKGDFISSILAYAGGYNNDMSVYGETDRNGNWFAGSAIKGAYNFRPTNNFIIQPSLMASYNIFGKQSWNTKLGDINMTNGMLNGINIVPGLNLIYARDTWSVYNTIQYLFNINDGVSGSADGERLQNIKMSNGGFIEYGIGATKTWKERFGSYVQITVRNGNRTGVGFQAGLNFRF